MTAQNPYAGHACLNDGALVEDMPEYKEQARKFSSDFRSQWRLFRSLVNFREPRPMDRELHRKLLYP